MNKSKKNEEQQRRTKKEKQNRLNAKLMIDGHEHEEADDKVASLHDSHFDNVSHQFK